MKTNRITGNRQGFTLIELMVVVGLIGLLTLFAIPAFQSAGQGSRVRTAAFQLNTTLSLARQTAITTRQTTYVVFPDDEPTLYSGTNSVHVEKAFRSYAVYGENDGYMTEWRMLPPGVVIDPDFMGVSNHRNLFLIGSGNTFLRHNIPFPFGDSPGISIYAFMFRRDGLAGGTEITHSAAAYLTEGWTEYNNQTGQFTAWHHYPQSPLLGVRVSALTGQSRMGDFERP